MGLDQYKNRVKVVVSAGYDAAATSIVLNSGEGAKLPATPCNAVWYNATDYPDPCDDPNAEDIRVTVRATDTLTITRNQEQSAASAKNVAGKTYKLLFGVSAKLLTTDLFTLAAFGVLLPNALGVRVFGSNLALGDSDLYTVPSGRRAIVGSWANFNPSAGSISFFAQVKISGTYYRLAGSSTSTAGTGTSGATAIVLEPNDVLAINTTTTAGLNISFSVIEFDNTSGLKSARLAGPSTGDNTLYTCPANKTAYMVQGGGTFPFAVLTAPMWAFVADAGGVRNIKYNLVPSGGTPGSTNQIFAAQGIGASQRSAGAGPPISMGALDFLSLNVDVGNAAQFAWVTVVEQ